MSAPGADTFIFSTTLKRSLSSLTNTAFVRFDALKANVCLATTEDLPTSDRGNLTAKLRHVDVPGEIADFRAVDPEDTDGAWARGFTGEGAWVLFRCEYDDGGVDMIALELNGGAHDAHCKDVLAAIWRNLREDCLKELEGGAGEAVSSALLWTISHKTDSAVLVLDGNGIILEANAAGREVLEQGDVVCDVAGQFKLANPNENKSLSVAMRECLAVPEGKNEEFILFLEGKCAGGRLPLSLSQYRCAAYDTPLIIAILPCQPDIKRIEMLAQKMGLSPAESRVAALMQLGLPNRKAAAIAGVKEQTFNTYAKRVLSKLDMGNRAEMAHVLTWQSSVGRAS
jgi:DNA-binding CsgD family transcriptional regulator